MNILRQQKPPVPTPCNHRQKRLTVEMLEPRMMLSTVSIFASGQTGQENVEIDVSGELAFSQSGISSAGEVLTFDVADGVSVEDLEIRFTNDRYLPEEGLDRNLVIQKVVFDGVEFLAADDSVFSTGTWRPEDGVSPGFGRGGTLHANGFLKFADNAQAETIDWQGATWTASDSFNAAQVSVDSALDEITVSGVDGPISIARQFDVVGEGLFLLSANAYRNVIQGEFGSDNQPWSTIGVNFYDINGQEIGQETIEFNSGQTDPSNGLQTQEVVTPVGATSAFVWIWIDRFTEGTNIPVVVRDLDFTQIDISDDQRAPLASLAPLVVNASTGEEINFLVEFRDDVRLGNATEDAIRVTGPGGFDQVALGRTGGPVFNDQIQQVIYGIVKSTGDWDASDNGIYTVFLTDNSLRDLAGNVAPGGLLGTFEIAIN